MQHEPSKRGKETEELKNEIRLWKQPSKNNIYLTTENTPHLNKSNKKPKDIQKGLTNNGNFIAIQQKIKNSFKYRSEPSGSVINLSKHFSLDTSKFLNEWVNFVRCQRNTAKINLRHNNAEKQPGIPQTSKSSATMIDCFYPSSIVSKLSILNVCRNPGNASVTLKFSFVRLKFKNTQDTLEPKPHIKSFKIKKQRKMGTESNSPHYYCIFMPRKQSMKNLKLNLSKGAKSSRRTSKIKRDRYNPRK